MLMIRKMTSILRQYLLRVYPKPRKFRWHLLQGILLLLNQVFLFQLLRAQNLPLLSLWLAVLSLATLFSPARQIHLLPGMQKR